MNGDRATRAQVDYSLRWADSEDHPDIRRLHDEVHALRADVDNVQVRLDRIADAHQKYVDALGGTDGECRECRDFWPCPTYVWATTDRVSTDPWNPRDDEPSECGGCESPLCPTHGRLR